MCRILVSFASVYHVGVWFGFVRSALLLAVVLCWVDRCFDSQVLLGLLCNLRATQQLLTTGKQDLKTCLAIANMSTLIYT